MTSQTPHTSHESDWHATQEKLLELVGDGAVPVAKAFSPAVTGQGDVVYKGRRFLVTPNDDAYRYYADALQHAGLPYVTNDPELGSEKVVVGEISRDARLLPQVMLGAQSEAGLTSRDVFYMFGRAVGRVMVRDNLVPKAEDMPLNRVMIVRAQAEILLTPPLHFEPVTGNTKQDAAQVVGDELHGLFSKFDTDQLLNAYREGLDNDRG